MSQMCESFLIASILCLYGDFIAPAYVSTERHDPAFDGRRQDQSRILTKMEPFFQLTIRLTDYLERRMPGFVAIFNCLHRSDLLQRQTIEAPGRLAKSICSHSVQ